MKSIALLLSAVLMGSSALAVAQAPKPHDIEDFIREERFREIAVSPQGTYVAAAVPKGDKTVLVILKTGETKPLTQVGVEGKRSHVAGITWVSDNRLVYYVAIRDQLDERPAPTGEMWAINADGSKPVQLGGWKPDNAGMVGRAGGAAAKEAIGVSVLNSLDDSDEYVVAAIYRGGSDYTTAERMNVYSGTRLRLAQAPIVNANLYTDNRGNPRFAQGFKFDRFLKLYHRGPEDKDWTLVNDEGETGKIMRPIGFSADDKTAYLISEEKKGPNSVVAYDTATGEIKTLVRDTLANPSGTINAIGKRHIIGVYYAGAKIRYEYFDPESAEAKAHRALQRGFPGLIVDAASYVTAKNEVLLYASGDREPGGYYVMNLGTKQVSPMMFMADWLDPNRLSVVRDTTFTARDGRTIPVMLTLPPGSDGKNLPMIVHPHGGPFTIWDAWGYDPTVQMLASHGYAVLQVNFRGSGGYGREHQEAGYKQWGLTMQDDLTDATRWAISEGIADRNRICIYGASYGGYASLMGVAKEPDLYKCAIGQVGVYDLAKVKFDDSLGNDMLRRFFEQTMNDGDLGPVSPNRFAEKVRVPVFLSAGHEDETAPVEHTEMMEAALKKAGVPVQAQLYGGPVTSMASVKSSAAAMPRGPINSRCGCRTASSATSRTKARFASMASA